MMPPFDPDAQPELDDTSEQESNRPAAQYIMQSEAGPDDRITFMDRMAIFAAIAAAQLLRLLIIVAAIGVIALIIFIGSHV